MLLLATLFACGDGSAALWHYLIKSKLSLTPAVDEVTEIASVRIKSYGGAVWSQIGGFMGTFAALGFYGTGISIIPVP